MRLQFAIKCGSPGKGEKSSTWGELSAIEFSLRSFTELLKSTHVRWFTDSQAAAKIVEVGSVKFELHVLALTYSHFALITKSHWIFNGFQGKKMSRLII